MRLRTGEKGVGRGWAATWGHPVPAFWVFSWWVVTKRSSRSLMVWLRIFLKNSDGLVNQTGHLGHPRVLSRQLSGGMAAPEQGQLLSSQDALAVSASCRWEGPLDSPRHSGPQLTRFGHHSAWLGAGGAHEQKCPFLTPAWWWGQ